MDDLKEGDIGLSFTCAINCDVIYEWRNDWVSLRITSTTNSAVQELYVHKKCLTEVLGECVPLGEVFD